MPLPIELILMRQLASHLRVPIFLVDGQGTLLFYNEPAEALLGRRFDEAGEMKMARVCLKRRCRCSWRCGRGAPPMGSSASRALTACQGGSRSLPSHWKDRAAET